MRTATWKIEGMHCEGCAQAIRVLVESEAGVHASEVSYAGGTARVHYDAATTSESMLAGIIERAGFRVTPA